MKLRLTLAALTLLGLPLSAALGQADQTPPVPQRPAAEAPALPPAPNAEITPACGAACAPACCAPACCCEEVCKKTCIAVPDTRKRTHTCYRCKCIDFCLPRCTLQGCKKSCDDCGSCGEPCAKCGHPRVKKVLLKKFVVEEECATKCEVVHETQLVPVKSKKFHWPWEKKCCDAPSCGGDGPVPTTVVAPAAPGTAKGPEPIGPPKEEKDDK